MTGVATLTDVDVTTFQFERGQGLRRLGQASDVLGTRLQQEALRFELRAGNRRRLLLSASGPRSARSTV